MKKNITETMKKDKALFENTISNKDWKDAHKDVRDVNKQLDKNIGKMAKLPDGSTSKIIAVLEPWAFAGREYEMANGKNYPVDSVTVTELAESKIEAYGTKGMKGTSWRKTFKNADALTKWAEDNDAQVLGQRDVEVDTYKESEVKEVSWIVAVDIDGKKTKYRVKAGDSELAHAKIQKKFPGKRVIEIVLDQESKLEPVIEGDYVNKRSYIVEFSKAPEFEVETVWAQSVEEVKKIIKDKYKDATIHNIRPKHFTGNTTESKIDQVNEAPYEPDYSDVDKLIQEELKLDNLSEYWTSENIPALRSAYAAGRHEGWTDGQASAEYAASMNSQFDN